MPDRGKIGRWVDEIRDRYTSYLATSFYFRDPEYRRSFRDALGGQHLLKGPYPEHGRQFRKGTTARELASAAFASGADDLFPALLDGNLHEHQERAIRAAHFDDSNIVVASGTASGKTECFLYPLLFSLFQEHLDSEIESPGVRAVVLYPMNALVNDQRERLGSLCRALAQESSDFRFTFGQYIGQTPYNARDRRRNGAERQRTALPGEIVFRETMWETPPHVLFTNYSMLEYLLLRPQDTPLFDGGRAEHWKFLVLDEAHVYRGAKGIEMAMLLRRLKQRLREGGRKSPFRCITTSATIASGRGTRERKAVADFATSLFGEPFRKEGVVFGTPEKSRSDIRRHHVFVRALEGAFLLHDNDGDRVVLNRVLGDSADDDRAVPLEIALCRECGQHYYVGRVFGGKLVEAVRDRSRDDFGVDFFLPLPEGQARPSSQVLCRRCGAIGVAKTGCGCRAEVGVKKCDNRQGHRDQIKRCESCGYSRGGVGDPVQEIVHGADGPNAVIATVIHELLPPEARRILAFADSRQDAAFFAWYAEDSYNTIRDRNLIAKALRHGDADLATPTGRRVAEMSLTDLGRRLAVVRQDCGLMQQTTTWESEIHDSHATILREAVTEDARLSLAGVGLAHWTVQIPGDLVIPHDWLSPRWSLHASEVRSLVEYLLDGFRRERALSLPKSPQFPIWKEVSRRPELAFTQGTPASRRNVREWGGKQSGVVQTFLPRVLAGPQRVSESLRDDARDLMKTLWVLVMERDDGVAKEDRLFVPVGASGAFRLNSAWLRVRPVDPTQVWECRVCARVTSRNIRNVCPRNRCHGSLVAADARRLDENHYRSLYMKTDLPPTLRASEHTAQLEDGEARRRQSEFKSGAIHLLSSSTTFEVGVDLGALDVTFLRNVPPEPFNYTQRVGRAGRGERAGLALTYCRRSPHDLHHFANPQAMMDGRVLPPRLVISNPRIVIRHLTAMVLSAFFRDPRGGAHFGVVDDLFDSEWDHAPVLDALAAYCRSAPELVESLRSVVPSDLHDRDEVGLDDGRWIDRVTGSNSRLALAIEEVRDEYRKLAEEVQRLTRARDGRTGRFLRRMRTIAEMEVVQFLARKAVIPKYGFPVDVVELHTAPWSEGESVQLDRDLSLAISEYAPGSRIVANKMEWKSCGIRRVEGHEPTQLGYTYDEEQNLLETGPPDRIRRRKYLVPEFGFVVPSSEKPKPPERRSQRLFSTRPFFRGFVESTAEPVETVVLGVRVSEAVPGELVVLCEGKKRAGFLLCGKCGRHEDVPGNKHETPWGGACTGSFARFALGHEVKTDVVRARFPEEMTASELYSVAYALVLGAADALAVPQQDLNVTFSRQAIVLYDDVPGGAGLVAQLKDEGAFRRVVERSRDRVAGECGCDTSCYGCLRSYRNQFFHTQLDRRAALIVLEAALRRGERS